MVEQYVIHGFVKIWTLSDCPSSKMLYEFKFEFDGSLR